MALLASRDSERPLTLASHCLVGRSPACNLRLADRRTSGEHARISWHEGRWVLRDLGSRNGTFLNGKLLERGGTAVLSAGDQIGFGHASLCYELIDASPPVALARHLGTGEVVLARDGLLALPHEDGPVASVFEDRRGQWMLELDGEASAAEDGAILSVLGEAYMLHLPLAFEPTADDHARRPRGQDVELCFRVSQNEEHVQVLVHTRAGTRVLAPRAHYYTFLTLARARLRDEADRALPEAARGWMAMDDLRRVLAADETRINVDIHRIRRDLAGLDLHNPAAVVERKRGQLRLASRRIEILSGD